MADDPTGNLDGSTADQVVDLLLEPHARGTVVIVVTYDAAIAAQTGRWVHLGGSGRAGGDAQRADVAKEA